ncbi:SDR family NAD(P)-dependent oxidoreductase [Kitasatospora purpeofusca]|uniref:SDR family NAD(P)-dependent oxidoreductase n=1 Tax=Kitasatospora purpeofusca TaxID=67352 RepID=UPI0036C41E52
MLRTELIRPLPELLAEHARDSSDKTAFRDAVRGVTYAELHARTGRLAGHLADLRLQPGDRAAILLGNSVEVVESYFGILRAGAIGVPLNPHATEAELTHLLDDSGARVVITDAARAAGLDALARARADLRVIVTGEAPVPAGTLSFETLATTDPATPARDDLGLDDPAWMLYTSGTTGRPKGVLSTQRNCLWSVAACYVPVPGLSAEDRVVWPLPLFHSLSHIACVLSVTAVGATARILDGFAAADVLEAVREESATFLAGVPTMYQQLVRAAREDGFSAPALRMCLVGGAMTTAALRRSFEEAFGATLIDAYGSTETCGSITVNWPTGARVEGSCGLPVPGLGVRLVDVATGLDVADGEEGEVWVRGPSVMLGYHNQPEATEQALRGGWYHTGDLARRDGSGYFTITGRIKELIIRGGENIHPAEVEEVLRGVPGVADVAVVGKPHEVLGEVPVAFLVPGPGGLDPEALLAACRERLSYFKVPEELYETERIPRTASGKITRHVLLDAPARLRAAGGSHYEHLFRVDWLPLSSVPGARPAAGTWAVLGADAFGLADALGAAAHPDPAALAGAGPLPDAAVLGVGGGLRTPGPLAADVEDAVRALDGQLTAWLAEERLADTALVVVTRGAAGPGGATDLVQAALRGVVRAARVANPGRFLLVDLDAEENAADALATAVASGEPELVVRSGVALRPRAARVSAALAHGEPGARFDPRRAVLVTGADGPAAAAVAHHLVAGRGVRRILLTSPHGPADRAAAELAERLTAAGAETTLSALDLADRDALADWLAGPGTRFNAVVHTPGAAFPGLGAALAAAVNLHELTAGTELSAFVVHTPTVGPLGTPGAPGEAAAAAFLDALAHHRSRHGLPGLALITGPADGDGRPVPPGLGRLTAQESAAAFDAAHLADHTSLLLLRLDPEGLDTLAPQDVPALLRDLIDTPAGPSAPDTATAAALRRRLAGRPAADRQRELLDLVLAETAGLAGDGPDPIRPDGPFKDLGFTSATAVELRGRLTAATGLRLPATLAFDHPNPTAVAAFLVNALTGRPAAAARPAPVPRAVPPAEDPVVIVGAACRLPGGVASPADLWRLVAEGTDAITPFPADRGWDLDALYDPDPTVPGTSYARHGGFLHDAADFDAAFFGISPREALATDPQQRLLLETSWELLERAGIDPTSLKGQPVGVYAGLMYHDYATDLAEVPDGLEGYLGTGNAGSVASGRISYTLGLEGPSVTVDTACSSSLVALHLAAQALRDGEATLALAGGAAIMARPTSFVEFSRQRALSADGRARAYADGADGTAWAEGVGLVLLERLSDARRLGHEVLAVVRGSAVNQDGASNGLTAPNGPSQERVILAALANAGLTPADVDAVEGHGTGTSLGDPIEAQAVLATYGQGRPVEQPLWLGSLKSNLGHAQAAAGVAGVIKMVEALRHGVLPKSLHIDAPSTKVDWESGAVALLTEERAWPEVDRPRRAAVSSFGVSGTNAHVILEQAPAQESADRAEPAGLDGGPDEGSGTPVPWLLSARSPEALREQAEQLAEFTESRPDAEAPAVARALAGSRAALERRAVVVAADRARALSGLRALADGEAAAGLVSGRAEVSGRSVFVFPGQGSQWVGMGRRLLAESAVFARALEEAAEALEPYVDWSLLDVVNQVPGAASLERVDVVQPVSFAVNVGLARLWASLGVVPDAVVGHSQGEIAAAHVAGILSLEDAAAVVALRSQAIARGLAGRGGMVSLGLPLAEVTGALPDGVEVAAVNGPSSVVVAGDPAGLDTVVAAFEERGARVRRIPVDYASHTAHVESIEAELAVLLSAVKPRSATIPFLSTVENRWVEGPELDAGYWYRNLRQTVRFAEAVDTLAGEGFRAFVEVSAHPVLAHAVVEALEEAVEAPTVVTGTLRREDGGWDRVLLAAAELHVRGIAVDWSTAHSGSGTVRPSELPTYPFQHQRYWLEPGRAAGDLAAVGLDKAGHPLLEAELLLGTEEGAVFTGRVTERTLPWLADHRVGGVTLLPGTALLDALAHVGRRLGAPTVEELTVSAPLVVPDGGGLDLQVHVGEAEDGRRTFRLLTRTGTGLPWHANATGTLAPEGPEPAAADDLTVWPPAGARPLDLDGLYDRLTVAYGPAFHAVEAAWLADGRLYAQLRLPDTTSDAAAYGLHPALLDAALHPLGEAGFFPGADVPRLAFSWAGVRLHAVGAEALRVVVTLAGPDTLTVRAADDTGAPVVDVEALTVRPVDPRGLTAGPADDAALFEVDWVPAPETDRVPAAADRSPADWALHSELPEDGALPPLVVLPAGVGAPSATVPERAHAVGHDVLRALQAWLADERTADSRLVVVTRRGELVQEPVRGLVRTAQSENPGRFVLVEADDPADAARAVAAAPVDEPQLALRDGRPLVARLRRPAARPAPAAGAPSPLAGGTVLVTGANGGLGRLVARHLAAVHRVAELVLLSRSAVPADLLEELAAHGTLVRAEAVDTADRTALAAVVDTLADRLTGVVHVAGIVDDGVIEALDAAKWHSVLRPKVDAAWHLHELTAGLDLAAFALYSSASGVLGGSGQGNYAAGNAFLDGLAAHRRSLGLPAVSLAWGLWAEAAGMGGRLSDTDLARMARVGTRPLSADQGLALLDAALTGGPAAVVPIRLDVTGVRTEDLPPLLRDLAPAARAPRVLRRAAARTAADGAGALARRLGGLSAADRDELLTALVRDTAAAVLGHGSAAALDVDKAFKELGIDSLTAVELRNALGTATGLRLPATLVFNYPTPKALAAHLATELVGEEPAPAAPATPAAPAAGTEDEPIAIVAVGCRFPGGLDSGEDLWRFVAGGGDAVTGLPTDRGWDLDGSYDPDPDAPGRTYVRGGGFLPGIADFDAAFFGINPREALAMDPQQRLLLEVAWETLERAGLDPTSLRATPTGVFIGTHGQDYGTQGTGGAADEGYLVTGNAGSVLSGRLSYALGLEGPAITVDTACSSSLVALHLAAQALRAGECTLALAGGASVMSTLEGLVGFSRQRGLATDGRSKAFADAADGFGMSEGVGLLLLERLSDARRLGHEVLAVVRGSAVNQDGASNGLTAPNGPSQERVIRAALANARLTAADVDAVEAHGTGTPLGDPIEAHALLATYGKGRPAEQPLWLGSVKSNIGHTQAAAGAAGVIKMVEALRHGVLPQTLHIDAPSSHIDWSSGGIALLTEQRAWPEVGRPRRAGVSAFGVSGTNAHVILEQAEPVDPAPATVEADGDGAGAVAWVVSGTSEAALREQAARLAAYAQGQPAPDLAATARALVTARTRFPERAVVVGADRAALVDTLKALADGEAAAGLVSGRAEVSGRSVFVFPGQGSQWVGMGRRLLAESAVFAEALGEVGKALEPYVDWSLLDVVNQVPGAASLERVDVVQPVSFAVNVGLARLWASLGVVPDAVVGHSQGEIAAAHVAGILSLEDAAAVVALRSQAIARGLAGRGGMVSVARPFAEVTGALPEGVEVAAVNGPTSVVVAGDPAGLDTLVASYEEQGVRVRRIAVDYASHTSHVESIEAELAELLGAVKPQPAVVPFLSTVENRWVEGPELDAGYWYRNLRQTVRFAEAVGTLAGEGFRAFVEISAHPVLANAVVEALEEAVQAPTVVTGTLRREDGGWDRVLLAAAELHVHGLPVDWSTAHTGAGTVRPSELPTYAFQHQRFWLEPVASTGDVTAFGVAAAEHPLLGTLVELPDGGTVFTGRLSIRSHPWLAGHAVSGTVLLPGAAFLELALRAGEQTGLGRLEELVVEAPGILPERGGLQVRVTVDPAADDDRRAVHVHSRPEEAEGGAWTRHATGFLAAEAAPEFGYESWPPAGAEPVPVDGFYERLAEAGYEYGDAFRGLRAAWRSGEEVFAEVALPEELADSAGRFGLHPALLDAALQSANLGAAPVAGPGEVLLPFAWNDVALFASGATALRVRSRREGPDSVSFALTDPVGRPVGAVGALVLRPVAPERLSTVRDAAAEHLYRLDWAPADLPRAADRAAEEDVLDLTRVAEGLSAPQAARALAGAALGGIQEHLAGDSARPLAVLTANAASDPAASAVRGLVRTAQLEHPGRIVLVDTDGSTAPASLVADALASGEPQVAWRDGGAVVPRLARAEVPSGAGPVLDPAGTVLVTGGTGTLGGLVARRLVESHGVRHLLLVSRRGAQAPGAAELVEGLQALGASVEVLAADVSERSAVDALVAGVPTDRPLTAVVHTAGALADGVFEAQSAERLDEVFAPKADAAWHLHEATEDLGLTAFVLFSSGAGVFGSAGQSLYGSANGFLDGLAGWRRERGLPAVSLAWGLWAQASGLTGHLDGADRARLARGGLAAMPTEEALALFDAALRSPEALLVPTRLDREALRKQAAGGELNPLLRGLVRSPRRTAATGAPAADGREVLLRRLSAVGEAEQLRLLLDLVRASAAKVLGQSIDETVKPAQAFKDVGFDSLTSLRIRGSLTEATGVRLPATLVFDHPTPAAVAEYLRDRLGLAGSVAVPPVLLELDRLEQALAATAGTAGAFGAPDGLRAQVAARLEALTARWAESGEEPETEGVDLGEASDDELFDLIDNELGLS